MEQLIFSENFTPKQAITEVIKNNKRQKYNPQRFINMMDAKDNVQLISKIEGLIVSSEEKALGTLLSQIFEKKYILTIEDFVLLFGETWDMSPNAIQTAQDRVKLFDECARGQRFDMKIV
ncbi:hypothetical protein QNH20_12655 [Neobacillus sp. WH10]|uniref:hypothetical protein n=1 Tax=Neobacillus sp. WH10 TaxID=3047873 RepID=UPI0024C19565|nr:hypothetical protein [Neobacillus sp. WH10]WHY79932.1 hypothetical protein QNH20_12655 [Neobacillus sp. WH10]